MFADDHEHGARDSSPSYSVNSMQSRGDSTVNQPQCDAAAFTSRGIEHADLRTVAAEPPGPALESIPDDVPTSEPGVECGPDSRPLGLYMRLLGATG